MSSYSRVAFYTLGCKVNQYETEIIKKDFLENGYKEVKFEEEADVYIINTCTVTSVADSKNRKIIRRAKKNNEQSTVIVTGCYAQTNATDLKEMKDIDFIIGNSKKENIFEIYNKKLSNYQVNNIFEQKEYETKKFPILRDKMRAFVKIQDGCNKFCSYCKIPYARGMSRSRNEEDILEEITYLSKKGYKEIVITGINLSEYGYDLEKKTDFDTILEKILKIDFVERVRISSVYPDTITEKFKLLLKNNKKLMPHLHVSIQSLDDKILKLMKRDYSAKYVVDLLNDLQIEIPDLALTADIIVGFPQEEKENFENTLTNIEKIKFSDFHIFPYSDREKTAASTFQGKIDLKEKRERIKKLELIKNKKYDLFRENIVDTEQKIYIEEIKNDFAYGYTENYLKVKLNNNEYKLGEIVTVKIKDYKNKEIEGE